MSLPDLWFLLIAVLWGGYFLLEGFDFGVGMLLPVLGRREEDRTTMFKAIGPVWDGNEVWLVIAAGATFAAFPEWYATMFSGFYLVLLVILVCLIVRVVSFEWRDKSEDPRWRAAWRWANTVGSIAAPFLWGVALANLLHGVPLDAKNDFAGDLWDLLSPYTIFAGLVVVVLFAFHGASYLVLRTTGDLCERAGRAARRLAVPAALGVCAFGAWTVAVAVDANAKDVFPPVLPAAIAGAALVLGAAFAFARRTGWTFVMTAVGTVAVVATIFTALFPRVMVSSPAFANSLTVENASSSHYALTVISVVALVLLPVVLLYQAWTYYVFRARVGGEDPARTPLDAVAARSDGAGAG